MTKKHFEELAKVFSHLKPGHEDPEIQAELVQLWNNLMYGIMDVCSKFNKRFNEDKFIRACHK